MGLMDAEYFRGCVENHALVRADERCRPVLNEVLQLLYDRDVNSLLVYSNPLSCPRLPHTVLLALAGWSGRTATNSMESYDVRSDRWVSVTDEEELPRAYPGVVFLRGSLYCVGGFDGTEYYSSVRRFDLAARRWHSAAPMHEQRCYVSVVVLDGCIYAMGGHNGHTRLRSLERYQPEENQWTLLASMHEQRSDASATVLHGKVRAAQAGAMLRRSGSKCFMVGCEDLAIRWCACLTTEGWG